MVLLEPQLIAWCSDFCRAYCCGAQLTSYTSQPLRWPKERLSGFQHLRVAALEELEGFTDQLIPNPLNEAAKLGLNGPMLCKPVMLCALPSLAVFPNSSYDR